LERDTNGKGSIDTNVGGVSIIFRPFLLAPGVSLPRRRAVSEAGKEIPAAKTKPDDERNQREERFERHRGRRIAAADAAKDARERSKNTIAPLTYISPAQAEGREDLSEDDEKGYRLPRLPRARLPRARAAGRLGSHEGRALREEPTSPHAEATVKKPPTFTCAPGRKTRYPSAVSLHVRPGAAVFTTVGRAAAASKDRDDFAFGAVAVVHRQPREIPNRLPFARAASSVSGTSSGTFPSDAPPRGRRRRRSVGPACLQAAAVRLASEGKLLFVRRPSSGTCRPVEKISLWRAAHRCKYFHPSHRNQIPAPPLGGGGAGHSQRHRAQNPHTLTHNTPQPSIHLFIAIHDERE